MTPTREPAPTAPPVLVGSRCDGCGNVAYPAATTCQRCGNAVGGTIELSRRGTVWAYTVQRFAPKSPPYAPPTDGFAPFAVGYVELPEGVRVEARLDAVEFDELFDAEVTLTAVEPVPLFATDQVLAGAR